ncbi:MAG: SMP-30/gluconolactonase/LRE family protein [Acidimicrobiia bacterium]|nr:SMP-30/gluconolactonase/LRE family protein [Acidimicrobiia bacterium]
MADAPEVEELATGLAFPKGPVVLADGSFLVVEIRRATLTRVPAGGGTPEVVAELGGGPNGAAIGPDGAAYVVNNGGFLWSKLGDMEIPFELSTMSNQPPDFTGGWVDRVDLATGEHSVLYRECDGLTFLGPNDIVFDADGGFWFTDFGKTRPREADRGSLYYATADGSHIVQAARGLYGPNGVGLSPAGDRVYVAESFSGRLLAWDVTGPGQVASPMATVVEATKGHFDSLAVEADGAVVVAAIGQGLCVVQADGSGHEYVPIPDRFTTNVAFGGEDRRTAFVTLSGSGRLVAVDWPRPGLGLAY